MYISNEKLFRLLFENNPDAIVWADLKKATIIRCNKAAEKLFERSENELIGQSVSILHPSDKADDYLKQFKKPLKSLGTIKLEKEIITKTGEVKYAEISTIQIEIDGEIIKQGVFKDITEQKIVNETLKENEKKLRQFSIAVEQSPVAIVITDIMGNITYINNKFTLLTGYSYPDVIGKNPRILKSGHTPPETYKKLWEIICSGNTWSGEFLNINKYGQKYWEQASISPIKDEKGKITSFIAVKKDITAKKNFEEYLKRQSDFNKILSDITSSFITVNPYNLNKKIDYMLKNFGEFFNADRSYLFKFSPDLQTLTNTNEWCNEGISSVKDSMQNFPVSTIPWWFEQISKQKYVYIFDTNALPDIAFAEKEIFQKQLIKSLICVPIYDKLSSLIGFWGFDSVKEQKSWDEDVISLLKVIANTISDAIEKSNLEESLISAKEQAESANIAKGQFLANMSHEIRTPLNAVIGFTELVMATKLDEIQKDYMNNVTVSARALLNLINDILDFSKIDAGKMEFYYEKINVIELCENAMDIIKFGVYDKNVELILNISSDLPLYLYLDSVRVRQVLINLLGNAVKFTESGEIELHLYPTSFNKDENTVNVHFSVRDTGIGISEKDAEKLFKAFTQVDYSTTKKYGGTGLGLFISNHILEKFGTGLKLDSKPDIGSIFSFDLNLKYEDNEPYLFPQINKIKKVLIVDNNAKSLNALENLLIRINVNVEISKNSIEALEKIKSGTKYDVIFVDIEIPQNNCCDLFDKLNEEKIVTRDTRFILMIESLKNRDIFKKCELMGLKYKIIKPIKLDELLFLLLKIDGSDSNEIVSSKILSDENSKINRKPYNILIADDNAINLKLLKSLLLKKFQNSIIIEANNGVKAVELYKQNNFDIILMDVQMPGLDGYSASMEIRSFKKDLEKRVPIIAITAGILKGEKEKCLNAGMDDYIAKPVKSKELGELLEKWLINKKHENNLAHYSENIKTSILHFDKEDVLLRFGGDEVLCKELVEMFLDEFPVHIKNLEHSVSEKNFGSIKAYGHFIRGAALNVGFNYIASLAESLEHLENTDFDIISNLFDEIVNGFNYISKKIKADNIF